MKLMLRPPAGGWMISTVLALATAGCGGGGPAKSISTPPPDATGAMNATAGAVMNTSGPQGPVSVIAAPPK